jgi:NAD/NADP transhydrogenase alpha subunit
VIVGVPKESFSGERRVALVPAGLPALKKAGCEVLVESGAGALAGYPDSGYEQAGATVLSGRESVFAEADMILQVRALGASKEAWPVERSLYRSGKTLIATMDPLGEPGTAQEAAETGLTCFALELVPRITRAQAMDVLSSQASLAGYKAVLIAADALPKVFPMMMTAAGTITASRVLVIGAGVAGLQAIATARRLGAVVSGYDVRPAVKEQVESLGARFVQLEMETDAEGGGGYARAMDAAFYARQAELMLPIVAEQDVVITTAAVPGQKAPILVTRAMVERMRPGSVVVDLAAERGGNCELTRPGETVEHSGVQILGPLNLPSSVACHASQLFSKNVATFVSHLVKEGALRIDTSDEITRETLITHEGALVNARIRERLGIPT